MEAEILKGEIFIPDLQPVCLHEAVVSGIAKNVPQYFKLDRNVTSSAHQHMLGVRVTKNTGTTSKHWYAV